MEHKEARWLNGRYGSGHDTSESGHEASESSHTTAHTKKEDKHDCRPQSAAAGQGKHDPGYGTATPEGPRGACPHCTAVVLRHMAELMECYSGLAKFVGEDEALRLLGDLQALHRPSAP